MRCWGGATALAALGITLLGAGLKFEQTGEAENGLAPPASVASLGSSNAPSARVKATNTVGAFVLPEGSVVEGWTPPPPRNVVPGDLSVPEGDPTMATKESVWEQIGLVLAIVLALAVGLGLFMALGRFRRQ